MPDLKLAKLPNRISVKHAIVVTPDLEQKLHDYADLYRQCYGEAETIESLIPYMLGAFLESDRGFVKSRRKEPTPDEAAHLGKVAVSGDKFDVKAQELPSEAKKVKI